MNKEVILTGLRANGVFHLGNYLGAILPIIETQSRLAGKYQINMFVPDLHSFTTPVDHSTLYEQTLNNLKVYVAAGLNIDDKDTFIYRQSRISAHSELTWILDCFTYFGELRRMTQFKDKAQLTNDEDGDPKKEVSVTAGLFNYPVLMAADILLYDAKWVPVGEDQRQHLELARDLAIRINNKFDKEIFSLPADWKSQLEFTQREKGTRIRSLKNPEKKMSKSIDDPSGTILLTDTPDDAAKKVMSATTDSVGQINLDWDNQPGISNLLQIISLLDTDKDSYKTWIGKTNYGELKAATAKLIHSFLTELQEKLSAVGDTLLAAKLDSDEDEMRKVANAKLFKVQQAVGLRE